MHKENHEVVGAEPTFVELTHRVRDHFKLDWQRTIFDSAVESFNHDESPLRLKNFAFALGELARISQEQLAPKEKIRACKWFEQSTHLGQEDGVTRAQRVKYAVQGELYDDFIAEELHIDVESTLKECRALIDELNKYGYWMEQRLDKTEDFEALRALGASIRSYTSPRKEHAIRIHPSINPGGVTPLRARFQFSVIPVVISESLKIKLIFSDLLSASSLLHSPWAVSVIAVLPRAPLTLCAWPPSECGCSS